MEDWVSVAVPGQERSPQPPRHEAQFRFRLAVIKINQKKRVIIYFQPFSAIEAKSTPSAEHPVLIPATTLASQLSARTMSAWTGVAAHEVSKQDFMNFAEPWPRTNTGIVNNTDNLVNFQQIGFFFEISSTFDDATPAFAKCLHYV